MRVGDTPITDAAFPSGSKLSSSGNALCYAYPTGASPAAMINMLTCVDGVSRQPSPVHGRYVSIQIMEPQSGATVLAEVQVYMPQAALGAYPSNQ